MTSYWWVSSATEFVTGMRIVTGKSAVRAFGMVAGGLALAVSAGCADLMLRSAVAPEWFEQKAREVEGEGYPRLKDAPVARETGLSVEEAGVIRERLLAEAAGIDRLEGSADIPSPEDIRARAAHLRALTRGGASGHEGEPY
jgi:hypothetical protein